MNGFLTLVTYKEKYLKDITTGKLYKYNDCVYTKKEDYSLEKEKLKNNMSIYDWSIDSKYNSILEKTYDAHSMRREFRLDLYQTPALPETVVRRANQIVGKGNTILLLGDDDLLSIPLALMGHKVTVIDIDDSLISVINRIAKEQSLDIECYKLNLFEKIPLDKRFEYFFADPVSTYEGFQLFIDKGLSLLKKNGVGIVSINQRFDKEFKKYCHESSIQCQKKLQNFNNYYDSNFCLIDDKTNLYTIKCEDKFRLTYSHLDVVDINLFESQRHMKIFNRIEVHNVDNFNKEKMLKLTELLETVCKISLTFEEAKLGMQHIMTLMDNEDNISIQIVCKNKRVLIEIESGFCYDIRKIRESISDFFDSNELFIIQLPCNSNCLSNVIEMNIN